MKLSIILNKGVDFKVKGFCRKYGFDFIFALCFLFLSFLFLFPFISLMIRSFSLSSFLDVIRQPYLYRILFNTLRQAVLSVLLSLFIAGVCLFVVCRADFKFKEFFMSVTYLPFVIPSIIIVLAFVLLFGKNSPLNINILYSLKAVVIAHAFYNFPVIMHPIYEAYMCMNRSKEDVSYTLGAKPVRVFFTITLRELRNTLLSSLLLVFMYCFSSFAIVLTLGGGIKNTTLETEIYKNFKTTLNQTLGTAYALVSFLIMLLMTALYFALNAKGKTEKTAKRRILKKGGIMSSVFALIFGIVILAPVIRIVLFSFFPSGGRGRMNVFKAYGNVFSHYNVIINSMLVAFISASICVFLSFVISEYFVRRNKNLSAAVVFLPLSVSGIALSEGWRAVSGSGYFFSVITLSCVHAFLSFPLIYRYIDSGVRKIPLSVRNVSLTLGCDETYSVFKCDANILKSTLVKGFALALALSLNKVSSVLIVSRSSFTTISGAIYSYISGYDYASGASAAVVLIVLSLLLTHIAGRKAK